MSIRHCLDVALQAKEISRPAADELEDLFQRFRAQHALVHGDAEAQRLAREQLAARLESEAAQRRRAALLQAAAIERLHEAVFAYKDARGQAAPHLALIELWESHGRRDTGLAVGSVEGRRKALLGAAQAELEELLAEFSRDWAGHRRSRARLENVIRELDGTATGDEAAAVFAKKWAEVAEGLRQRYNESGGAIGKLERWLAPQMHDGQALRRVGFAAWSQYVDRQLDWDRMRHHLTGDPILPDERAEVLRHVYDTITTEGFAHRHPSMQPQGRGALFKQHADHRFLMFKDADAWLAYQRDFGQGDPFAAMMGHLKLMTRDIAAMQVLGPNPDASMRWLTDAVRREAQMARRGDEGARFPTRGEVLGLPLRNPVATAHAAIHRAETMALHYMGATDVAVSQTFADTMTTARNFTTAGSLGSAMLSAVTDPGFGAMARLFAGGASVPGGLAATVGDLSRQLKTLNEREAVRAGLILDTAANAFGQKAREAGTISGPVMSRFVAEAAMRYQGLQAWTQAGKHGFGLWLMGSVGDELGKAWDAVHAPVRRTLQRYGFAADEWDVIRLAPLHDLSATGRGATILRPREIASLTLENLRALLGASPELAGRLRALRGEVEAMTVAQYIRWTRGDFDDVPQWARALLEGPELDQRQTLTLLDRLIAAEADPTRRQGFPSVPTDPVDIRVARYTRDLAERYHAMILQETTYAVPEGTLRSKSLLFGETRAGTLQGEALRSFAQFKSFGVAVALLHGGRVFHELAAGRVASGAVYAAAGLAAMTTLGALAMQLKSIARGEDPRPVDDPRFWLAALTQGGGFGIYGDFFLAEQQRFGGGWGQTVAGPLIGRAGDIAAATIGNIREGVEGKKKTNWQREALKNVKSFDPLASNWFTKLAWERIVYQQLQRVVDPEASEAFARQVSNARRDRGTRHWWRPGETAPDRAPGF